MYSSFLFPFLKAGVFQGIEIVVETAVTTGITVLEGA